MRKLRDLARSTDERPWLLTASFTHPHDPYAMRQRYWDRYDHDAIDLPRVGSTARRTSWTRTAGGCVTCRPWTRRRSPTSTYVAPATRTTPRSPMSTTGSAELVETLVTCGMSDDTVVIFTADHGDMLGERGLWYKMSFFEGACRVPLIIAGPGVLAGEAPEHVSLLDVLPTLLDLAGVERPVVADGRSLVPLLAGDRDPNRVVVGEYLAEGAVAPILMIREGDLKFVYCAADPPQLYDLLSDPDELVNLASDPAHRRTPSPVREGRLSRWDPVALA